MERFAFQRGERTHERAEILCHEATVVFRRLRIHTTFAVKKASLQKNSVFIAKSLDVRGVLSVQGIRCDVCFTPIPIFPLRRFPNKTNIRRASVACAVRLLFHFALHTLLHKIHLQQSKLPRTAG